MSGQGIADDRRITGERGLLNDNQIAHLALWQGMIDPFVSQKVRRPGELSWGLEPFGYTLRLARTVLVPVQSPDRALDPKGSPLSSYSMNLDAGFTILPGQVFWASTIERIKLPGSVTMLIQGKSTYARAGLIVNTTPFDAGWEGYPTLTLLNPTTEAIMLYAEEGIAQALFFRGETPEESYVGNYQKAVGPLGGRNVQICAFSAKLPENLLCKNVHLCAKTANFAVMLAAGEQSESAASREHSFLISLVRISYQPVCPDSAACSAAISAAEPVIT